MQNNFPSFAALFLIAALAALYFIWRKTEKKPEWLRIMLRTAAGALCFSPAIFAASHGAAFAPFGLYLLVGGQAETLPLNFLICGSIWTIVVAFRLGTSWLSSNVTPRGRKLVTACFVVAVLSAIIWIQGRSVMRSKAMWNNHELASMKEIVGISTLFGSVLLAGGCIVFNRE